jgi:hypothetical protein
VWESSGCCLLVRQLRRSEGCPDRQRPYSGEYGVCGGDRKVQLALAGAHFKNVSENFARRCKCLGSLGSHARLPYSSQESPVFVSYLDIPEGRSFAHKQANLRSQSWCHGWCLLHVPLPLMPPVSIHHCPFHVVPWPPGNSTICTRTISISILASQDVRTLASRLSLEVLSPLGTVHSRTASFHFHCLGSLVLGRPITPLSGLAPALLITYLLTPIAILCFYSAISRYLIGFTRTQPRTEL